MSLFYGFLFFSAALVTIGIILAIIGAITVGLEIWKWKKANAKRSR